MLAEPMVVCPWPVRCHALGLPSERAGGPVVFMDIDSIMDTAEFRAGWEDASAWLEAHPRTEAQMMTTAEVLARLLP